MKLRWLLISLISAVLLSSSAKATPFNRLASNNSLQKVSILPTHPTDESTPLFAGVVPLGKEISPLKSQIQTLMTHYSFLQPGMFFLDLETGNYLDINGDKVFPAASTIKFPILVALFEAVDSGRVKLDESLVMRRDLVASGSGVLQYQHPGLRLSVLETATKMITISDNTATNMIIDRLGGKAILNERFQSWGLKNTAIHNLLGDFRGTNVTSSEDLVRLSALITNHRLISQTSYGQALDLMRHCVNKKLLADGLGTGAVIAHKTGDIGFVVGDAGIIDMPNGRHYLAGIFVRRPHDDERGREFVRRVSRLVYNYLEQQPMNISQQP
jgi:beta-lactamase class A